MTINLERTSTSILQYFGKPEILGLVDYPLALRSPNVSARTVLIPLHHAKIPLMPSVARATAVKLLPKGVAIELSTA